MELSTLERPRVRRAPFDRRADPRRPWRRRAFFIGVCCGVGGAGISAIAIALPLWWRELPSVFVTFTLGLAAVVIVSALVSGMLSTDHRRAA